MRAGSRAKEVLAVSGDPLRLAIVDRLALEPASAAELAAALDAPIEQVRYQLKRLRAAGLVRVHREGTRRGAIERTFIADCRKAVLGADEVRDIPEHRLRALKTETVRLTFREAVAAARTGALRNDERHFLIRIPLLLDARGFREVGERLELALSQLLELREECLARSEESGEKPRPATTGLFFLEMPD